MSKSLQAHKSLSSKKVGFVGKSERTETTLEDYSSILQLLGKDGLPRIMVGGQAVNFWAEFYLEADPQLNNFRPFQSKDLDLLGTQMDLLDLASKTGFKIVAAENKAFIPSAGYLLMPHRNGVEVKVEILKRIYGVRTHDIQEKALEFNYRAKNIRIIDPISLLQSKVENAVGLEQKRPHGNRQDEKHMRIMMMVVRAHLRGSIKNIGQEKYGVRDCLNLHEDVISICTSNAGKQAVRMYELNWEDVFPLKELTKSNYEGLRNFAEIRWPRVERDLP